MRSKDFYCIRRSSRQAGSTVVELVIALSVLAILSGLVYGIASNGFFRARENRQRTRETVLLATVDTMIRDSVGRVRPPYWIPTAPVAIRNAGRDSSVALRYIDGDPESTITIQSIDNMTTFGDLRYDGVSLAGIDRVYDDTGTVAAIRFELVLNERRLTTIAPLGAIVLEAE